MAARACWPALLVLIAGGAAQSSPGGAGLAVVVGTLELERRVRPELVRNPLACAERVDCLVRIGLALRVRRLVFGTVQSLGDQARIELALVDLAANQVDERYLAEVEAHLPAMIGAVGAGMDRLFRIGPLAPLASARLPQVKRLVPAAPVPPARELVVSAVPPRAPQRHRWAAPLAYATAMAAVACLSTGAVFGTLGGIEPNGATRAEAQDDLQRRKTYGRLGAALIVGGIVLTLGSTAAFAAYWRNIVGD
jgi:hypothetical protein